MGSGEPLSNYANVTKFLHLVTHKDALNISERNISLSTCGIAPAIKKLADDGFKISLTLSLHASNDTIRKSIMKIANSFSISQVMEACNYYYQKTGRRIMIEYILIDNVNVTSENAKELASLVKNLHAHVNLIPLNEVKEIDLKTVNKKQTYAFLNELKSLGVNATVRRTLGEDIEGACGQLRRSFVKND